MKSGLVELVFILDRSGSMEDLESDTIGGFNAMFKKQKEIEGDCTVTTVLFDDQYEFLHNRIDIKKVKQLTKKQYFVRGSTALLDAVGRSIDQIGLALYNTPEPDRPEKVMFFIITDGLENASQEYTFEKVKGMIEHQQQVYSWEFTFLGANIDAVNVASQIGISQNNVADYVADGTGTRKNFEGVDALLKSARTESISSYNDSKDIVLNEIREDYKKRGKIGDKE